MIFTNPCLVEEKCSPGEKNACLPVPALLPYTNIYSEGFETSVEMMESDEPSLR